LIYADDFNIMGSSVREIK